MANIRKFALPAPNRGWHRYRGGYSDASYQFTNTDRNSRTMATIAVIAGYNAVGYFPTRKEVAIALGDPDPTKVTGRGWKNRPIHSNWGCSRYNALQEAGFIEKERDGKTFRYAVTQRGYQALEAVTGVNEVH